MVDKPVYCVWNYQYKNLNFKFVSGLNGYSSQIATTHEKEECDITVYKFWGIQTS